MKDPLLRLNHLEKLVRSWTSRLSSIDHNLKHYVNKRLPIRIKLAEKRFKAANELQKLSNALKKMKIHFGTQHSGRTYSIFMCTASQARKLRMFADRDLRVKNRAPNEG